MANSSIPNRVVVRNAAGSGDYCWDNRPSQPGEVMNQYSVRGTCMQNGKRVKFSSIAYAKDFDELLLLIGMTYTEAEVTEVHLLKANVK